MTTSEKIKMLVALPGVILASKLPTPTESLRLLKMKPQSFQHAASSAWRSYEPGEAASSDATS